MSQFPEGRTISVRSTRLCPDKEEGDIDPSLRLPESRNAERDLYEFFEVIPGVSLRTGGVRKIGKVLADRIFDHRLVRSDDERSPGSEDEEPHGLQSLDSRIWKTTVEIVDEHHELVDAGLVEEFIKSSSEAVYLFRDVLGFSIRLKNILGTGQDGFNIFLGVLRWIGCPTFQCIEWNWDCESVRTETVETRVCGKGEAASFLRSF